MENGKWVRRLGSVAALVLAGVLMGSVMLTPVGAHITTFNHLKTKHFYTKKAADARFVDTAATRLLQSCPSSRSLQGPTSASPRPRTPTSRVRR
jgi:hypothetical protein